MSKLKFYGIDNNDFRLYQSYLNNRYCRTAISNDSENGYSEFIAEVATEYFYLHPERRIHFARKIRHQTLAVTPPRRYNALRQHEGGSYLTAVEWTGQTVTEVDMKRKLLPWTIEVPDHVYVLGYSYTCHTLNTTDIVLSSFPPSLPSPWRHPAHTHVYQ